MSWTEYLERIERKRSEIIDKAWEFCRKRAGEDLTEERWYGDACVLVGGLAFYRNKFDREDCRPYEYFLSAVDFESLNLSI